MNESLMGNCFELIESDVRDKNVQPYQGMIWAKNPKR